MGRDEDVLKKAHIFTGPLLRLLEMTPYFNILL
jgi:hypothetical protein